jgi:subtilisin family serine protease
MRFGRSWRRGVLWAALAVWGCGGGDEARESDADSGRGPTPDDLAGLIPDRPFPDFTEDDLVVNEVIGVRTVSERLLLGFEPDATAAQIADALSLAPAEVEGGLPEGGVVLLRFPGASDAEVAAARERLSALPGVSGAAEIGVIAAFIAPRSTERSEGPYWSWSGQSWPIPTDKSTVNGTWALRTISAPNAWNLLPWLKARPGRTHTPRVGIIDVDLFAHDDVSYTRVGERRMPRLTGSPHAVMVMGTLGATWGNGAYTDGVAPQVEMFAVDNGKVDDEVNLNGVSTDIELFSKSAALLHTAARPRIINVSMGAAYSTFCNGNFRCDPRGPSATEPRIPDLQCDAGAERARTDALGAMFVAFSTRLQAGGPVLFVHASGNEGGEIYDPRDRASLNCPATLALTGTETYCQLVAAGCAPPNGLGGHPPARFSSPLAAAATRTGFNDVLVVDAAAPAEGSGVAWRLADFSNSGGQVVAPGETVVAPSIIARNGVAVRTIEVTDGTSFASPMVAGTAAFLLSIEPDLTNAELMQILTGFTQGGRVAGDTTSSRLDMMDAVLALDELRPNRMPRLGDLLADVDDGTADGFTRYLPDANGMVPYHGQRDVNVAAGKLDMADFRSIRDVYLAQNRLADLRCDPSTPACDLNRDGVPEPLATEPFPRQRLVGWQSPYVTQRSVEYLANRVRFSDPVQQWRGSELPGLIKSADVIVHPELFMHAAGADKLQITLDGEVFPSDPPAPNLVPLIEIPISGETVLTTPLRKSPRIIVRVVRGGAVDDRFFIADLDPLEPGEDRHVTLNPCAWTHDKPLLSPFNGTCTDPDLQLPDPNDVYFWIRFSGPDVPRQFYAGTTNPNQDTLYTAYEPWQGRTFLHVGALWRDDPEVILRATMEWLGDGEGEYTVGRFHEGPDPDALPTGIAFSADSPVDEPGGQRVNVDVSSLDMRIRLTQAGMVAGDDMIGTFEGESTLWTATESFPVQVEGGFRAKKHRDVPAP